MLLDHPCIRMAQLRREIGKALASPDVKEKLNASGGLWYEMTVSGSTPASTRFPEEGAIPPSLLGALAKPHDPADVAEGSTGREVDAGLEGHEGHRWRSSMCSGSGLL